MKKQFLLFGLALFVAVGVMAKKPLDHDAFDSW